MEDSELYEDVSDSAPEVPERSQTRPNQSGVVESSYELPVIPSSTLSADAAEQEDEDGDVYEDVESSSPKSPGRTLTGRRQRSRQRRKLPEIPQPFKGPSLEEAEVLYEAAPDEAPLEGTATIAVAEARVEPAPAASPGTSCPVDTSAMPLAKRAL